MIAKRIDTKVASPRIARLVRYVVAAQGGIDPRSWSRTADYVLNSGTSSRGEKVGGVRVTHCHTDDPAAATALIECTQAANTRSKTDKTYHLVFSFPPGEEPPLDVLHSIEDQLCAAIGYADHQRISAVHVDCDHLHVHVAINKIHPKGYQNIEPYFDKKKLMETCERLEIEYGLQPTNHGLHGEQPKAKIKDKQASAEAHSGVETLTGYVAREVSPALHKATSWQELHATLAEHGLEIKKRGAGLVIGNGETWVRASQCDRAFSLKGLTDRLGAFEVAGQGITREPYQLKPRQAHPSSAAFFEQYQRDQSRHKQIRSYGLEQAKYEGAVLEANLQKWKKTQRAFVKLAAKGPQRRAMLKMVTLQTAATRNANWRTIEAKRRKVISDTAYPSWAVWLSQQAECGDTEALDVLRSRGTHTPMQGDILTAAKSDTAATVILKRYQLQAGTNGVLTYSLSDGGLVIDRKTHVQSFRTTERSTLLSLELAAKRYKGQALIVEGQADFQNAIARLAGTHGFNVRFADPALEQARKAAKPKGKSINNEVEI
jgi:hypothetical protein